MKLKRFISFPPLHSVLTIHTPIVFVLLFITACASSSNKSEVSQSEFWSIDSQKEWQLAASEFSRIELINGQVKPISDSAYFLSKLKTFNQKRKLKSIVLKQIPQWDNWQAIPKTTPKMANNAPVFIPIADGDYWFLAMYQGNDTTGYHSWHSTDMKEWTYYGMVTTLENKWVTTAEYVDGKFYIYFDKPNDEDPHLIIDTDLTDSKQGKEIGLVFRDPSHGSDIGIFRDEDSTFHMIYEDWSPINPRDNSWDSPLAGHADSPDGINGFLPHEYPAPIDKRTKPTGEIANYEPHANQLIYGPDSTPYTYEVHEGNQDAYGDYTIIKVGKQYYIFCDYDSYDEEKSMRIGRWRSDDLGKEFVWDGEIGEGFHPDPTIGFAEGKFYLLVQRNDKDFISYGPWVNGVEVRAGVDIDDDGSIDKWTEFTQIKESYFQKKDFIKVIEVLPASLDLSELGAGFGFQFQFRLRNEKGIFPIIDSYEIEFM